MRCVGVNFRTVHEWAELDFIDEITKKGKTKKKQKYKTKCDNKLITHRPAEIVFFCVYFCKKVFW